MKKVLYIVSTPVTGNGGHYYSLASIVKKLSNKINCNVVVIGKMDSKVISELKIETHYIKFNGKNTISTINKLLRFIKKDRINIIHAFDKKSYFFGNIVSFIKKIPIILTKCGGKTSNFHPYCKNLILFSKENYNDFTNIKKFEKSNIYYIPNRVNNFENSEQCIQKIDKKSKQRLKILRISRIANYYADSLYQSIKLIDKMNKDGIDSILIIIGIVQSNTLYENLKKSSKNVIFYTKDQFTNNAKKCIDAADVVIGTGRSLMEAASKNKILLTPAKNCDLPVLVDRKNIQNLHNTNFSERNVLKTDTCNQNYNNFIELIKKPSRKRKYLKLIRNYFMENFLINDKVVNKYINIYNKIEYQRYLKIYDMLRCYYRIIQSFKSNEILIYVINKLSKFNIIKKSFNLNK